MAATGRFVPRPPVHLDRMVDDPEALVDLVRRGGPYPTLQVGAFRNVAELRAMGDGPPPPDSRAGDATRVMPSFRGFWVRDGRLLYPDAAPLFRSERFIDAALRLHDGVEVRPEEMYVNVNVPKRNPATTHIDIPAFRGIGRRDVPTWLLVTMRRSQLFDAWVIPVVAIVGWFYEGLGGRYTYWDRGPDAPPSRTEQPFSNTAVAGENDVMFHRGDAVGGLGDGRDGVRGMALDATVAAGPAGGWHVDQGGRRLGDFRAQEVRLCVSWTAQVMRSEEERRLVDGHHDDLTVPRVMEIFRADLAGRGIVADVPADPLGDPEWVSLLATTYALAPTIFPED